MPCHCHASYTFTSSTHHEQCPVIVIPATHSRRPHTTNNTLSLPCQLHIHVVHTPRTIPCHCYTSYTFTSSTHHEQYPVIVCHASYTFTSSTHHEQCPVIVIPATHSRRPHTTNNALSLLYQLHIHVVHTPRTIPCHCYTSYTFTSSTHHEQCPVIVIPATHSRRPHTTNNTLSLPCQLHIHVVHTPRTMSCHCYTSYTFTSSTHHEQCPVIVIPATHSRRPHITNNTLSLLYQLHIHVVHTPRTMPCHCHASYTFTSSTHHEQCLVIAMPATHSRRPHTTNNVLSLPCQLHIHVVHTPRTMPCHCYTSYTFTSSTHHEQCPVIVIPATHSRRPHITNNALSLPCQLHIHVVHTPRTMPCHCHTSYTFTSSTHHEQCPVIAMPATHSRRPHTTNNALSLPCQLHIHVVHTPRTMPCHCHASYTFTSSTHHEQCPVIAMPATHSRRPHTTNNALSLLYQLHIHVVNTPRTMPCHCHTSYTFTSSTHHEQCPVIAIPATHSRRPHTTNNALSLSCQLHIHVVHTPRTMPCHCYTSYTFTSSTHHEQYPVIVIPATHSRRPHITNNTLSLLYQLHIHVVHTPRIMPCHCYTSYTFTSSTHHEQCPVIVIPATHSRRPHITNNTLSLLYQLHIHVVHTPRTMPCHCHASYTFTSSTHHEQCPVIVIPATHSRRKHTTNNALSLPYQLHIHVVHTPRTMPCHCHTSYTFTSSTHHEQCPVIVMPATHSRRPHTTNNALSLLYQLHIHVVHTPRTIPCHCYTSYTFTSSTHHEQYPVIVIPATHSRRPHTTNNALSLLYQLHIHVVHTSRTIPCHCYTSYTFTSSTHHEQYPVIVIPATHSRRPHITNNTLSLLYQLHIHVVHTSRTIPCHCYTSYTFTSSTHHEQYPVIAMPATHSRRPHTTNNALSMLYQLHIHVVHTPRTMPCHCHTSYTFTSSTHHEQYPVIAMPATHSRRPHTTNNALSMLYQLHIHVVHTSRTIPCHCYTSYTFTSSTHHEQYPVIVIPATHSRRPHTTNNTLSLPCQLHIHVVHTTNNALSLLHQLHNHVVHTPRTMPCHCYTSYTFTSSTHHEQCPVIAMPTTHSRRPHTTNNALSLPYQLHIHVVHTPRTMPCHCHASYTFTSSTHHEQCPVIVMPDTHSRRPHTTNNALSLPCQLHIHVVHTPRTMPCHCHASYILFD